MGVNARRGGALRNPDQLRAPPRLVIRRVAAEIAAGPAPSTARRSMEQATSSSGIGQSVRSEIPMLSIIVITDHYYVAWASTLNLNSTVRQ
jgi:hypothetical protein